MQLEVNNLMSPGRNWFEPNGSGLSQVYMHIARAGFEQLDWVGEVRFGVLGRAAGSTMG